jgi:hypothetical protein
MQEFCAQFFVSAILCRWNSGMIAQTEKGEWAVNDANRFRGKQATKISNLRGKLNAHASDETRIRCCWREKA